MFNKLKQFKELRDQAKNLQNMLAEEKVNVERHGIKMTMDGNQHVVSLEIGTDLSAEKIQQIMPDIINDAIKQVQRIAAQKMQESGGLSNFGL